MTGVPHIATTVARDRNGRIGARPPQMIHCLCWRPLSRGMEPRPPGQPSACDSAAPILAVRPTSCGSSLARRPARSATGLPVPATRGSAESGHRRPRPAGQVGVPSGPMGRNPLLHPRRNPIRTILLQLVASPALGGAAPSRAANSSVCESGSARTSDRMTFAKRANPCGSSASSLANWPVAVQGPNQARAD